MFDFNIHKKEVESLDERKEELEKTLPAISVKGIYGKSNCYFDKDGLLRISDNLFPPEESRKIAHFILDTLGDGK